MNKYSKIKVNCSDNNSSSSSDSPDLMAFPQPPRNSVSSSHNHQGEGEVKDKRFGEALSRARSVSSSSSTITPRAIHCAVKRAFSMRRSSSVSEGYSRIHDQPVTPIEDEDGDDEGGVGFARSGKKKGKRGKILKVCKLLFGR